MDEEEQELFQAVDEFLEYPGQPNRRHRMMKAMVALARKHGRSLNTWCPSKGWIECWPEDYSNNP